MQLKMYKYGYLVAMLTVLLAMVGFCVSGCAIGKRGVIALGKAKVMAPDQAETESSIKETTTYSRLPIPAGTTITSYAIPSPTPHAENAVKEVYWPSESVLATQTTVKEATVSPQRKPDTAVEMRKLEIADRRILLFAAIGCLIAGIVVKAVVPAWPSLSLGLFSAAPIFFIAWKFAEIPWWISVLPIAIVIILVLGYKRADWDKNNDFIPDAFQKKDDKP